MAKAIPGIDLIFGSHAHLERELTRIPDTDTWYISPSQYLTYISRVEVTVANGKVSDVRGALVPVDAKLPEDRVTAQRVAKMQTRPRNRSAIRELFEPIGKLDAPLSMTRTRAPHLETMRTPRRRTSRYRRRAASPARCPPAR